jgi:P27 family predicted phage terminase small subunit
MTTPGRKPKPSLQVVKEGNPGKRPIRDAVTLPPSAVVEPDWSGIDPALAEEASGLWRKLAPTLIRSVGLVGEQQVTLEEYVLTVVRIRQGERAIARDGMVIPGAMGGVVKNPWTTVLNQYRSHLRSLTGELGLSPASATRITRPESSDDEDPFD